MRREARAVGFTLIELMIIVAVIGVAAALAAPNLGGVYRHVSVGTEGRRLYGGFLEALGAAARTGTPHCLLLDRAGGSWSVRRNANGDANCNVNDPLVMNRGGAAEPLPAGVGFGPLDGISTAFAAPYAGVAHDAWCTVCASTASSCALFFDSDGRVRDGTGTLRDGAVMIHDGMAGAGGRVMALVFIGATGNLRLFDTKE